MYLYWDSTYTLVIIGTILVGLAQSYVQATFNRYSEWATERGYTGRQVAMEILNRQGIGQVAVEPIKGQLTDHYDPMNKVLRLSEVTYDETSISAVAVAAHECGHAIQDAEGYSFLRLRSAIAPVAQFGSSIAVPLIIFGLILGWTGMTQVGVIAFALVLLFQIVTLPVEFDASRRALVILEEQGMFTAEELPAARKVLRSAAFTYVASTLSTSLQLLRFIILSNNRNRD